MRRRGLSSGSRNPRVCSLSSTIHPPNPTVRRKIVDSRLTFHYHRVISEEGAVSGSLGKDRTATPTWEVCLKNRRSHFRERGG
jgi:hypothetical protein